MAINHATYFQPKVIERFKLGSLTDGAAGKKFSFAGAKTVVFQSVDVVPLNDFKRSGTNRFGEVTPLGDTKQEAQMTRDRSFAFDIDAGDQSDQAIKKSASAALRRQIDEVVIPEIDEYRLMKWAAGAGQVYHTGSNDALTKNTILSAIMTVNGQMSNKKVPKKGRRLYIPVRNLILLQQADAILQLEGPGTKAVEDGVVGKVAGNIVIEVPDEMFPDGVEFLVKYKDCTADPVKLQNYHIRNDAQGFDGPVVEGRVYYDSFVHEARKDGIGVCKLGAAE